MSKEFYDNTQNHGSEEPSYLPAYLKPKVQSKIQPKVSSKIQPKLLTDLGKSKKQESGNSSSKLPDEVQAKMETSFQQDFSGVSIHTDSTSAKDINAKAYTKGSDIHFAPGEYNPSTQPGQELIGHELTHVVQQKQGRVGPGEVHGKDLEINMDPTLEKEADEAGKLASTGNSVPPVSNGKAGVQFKLTGIDNSTLSEITTTGVSSAVAKGDGLKAGVESSQKLAETDWSNILLYAAIFKEVGDKYGVPGALLAAIASRESRGGTALNDEGYGKSDANGYGLMQIDKNANASLTGKDGAYSKEHIETATKLFVKLFEEVKAKHPNWTLAWKLRGAVAAYNFGSDDVQTQENIDKGSTGNDYSADIWERAKYYAQKKEFAEAKNEAITNNTTTPATTTNTTNTNTATTNTIVNTTTTTKPAKEYVPVYYEMPEATESLVGVVGAAGAKMYTAEVINFVSDVSYLQKMLKDLGVLSEADYELESGQAGEDLLVPTNWPASEVPAPLSAVEKKLMDVYGKIPIGPQLSPNLIPKTIQAIRVYQVEVMNNPKADGSVSSTGPTLASMKANTAEKVAITRKNYAIKKKQEAEALRKKKEEEALKLAKEQEAIKQQQAYIASLKSVGDDKDSVKKIYDANIYDMRVLGKEMRKYAPHNPKLVIAMLKYMNYTDSDNLAFNITSNFSDGELGGLNHDLLNTLKEYLSAGWKSDTEATQIKRIEVAKGETKSVTPQIENQVMNGHMSYQSKKSNESYIINSAAHASQPDNTYSRTSDEMYGGKSNNTNNIKGSTLCNITSLCMVLCSIEPEDTVRNNVILLLKQHGKKITEEENVKMKLMQVEDLISLFFEQLGITYFVDKGLYSYEKTGKWHPHQVHACLNHVGILISKKTEKVSTNTANIIKKGKVVGKKDYKEFYTNEVLPQIKKGNPIYGSCYTTGSHIVSIIGVADDGIIINDPYGSVLNAQSKYLVHGRDISGMLALAKENLTLLKIRLKYNTKGYSDIESIINNKKGVIPNHLGERNFYDWTEVEKYDIGINLNIFEKKQ